MIYKNKLLVFIGPDGSGKTTVIDSVIELMNAKYSAKRYYTRFNNIPRLDKVVNLLKLRGSFHSGSSQVKDDHLPVKHTYKSSIAFWKIIILLFYEVIDYIVGYRSLFKFKKNGVCVFDRYIYEYYTEKNWSNNKYTFMRSIMKLSPKPDFIFYLDNCSDVIYSRKPELSIDDISFIQNRTVELLSVDENFIVIRTNKAAISIARDIIDMVGLK